MVKTLVITLALALLTPTTGGAAADELRFIVTIKPDDTESAAFMARYVARESVAMDDASMRVTVEHGDGARTVATLGGGSWSRETEAVAKKPKRKRKVGKAKGKLASGFTTGLVSGDDALWGGRVQGTPKSGESVARTIVAGQLLFDPAVLSSLVPWAPQLAKAQAAGTLPVSLPFVDAATGATGEAEARPTHIAALGPPEGATPVVQAWSVTGLGPDKVRLYVDRDGALVGVRRGSLYALREGWSWKRERPSGGIGGIGHTR